MPLNVPEKKILIVEDEQIVAHSIQRSLQRAGYAVTGVASSASEAFDCLEQSQANLVLMDIHIQGESDGISAAGMIREKFHLPVIYLTAHADVATLERAKLTEPLGYLVKPLNHANLPSAIEIALHKHEAERKLEQQRALLSTTLKATAEAVMVTNDEGKLIFLNRAAEDLTGWLAGDALGQQFETVVKLSGASGIPPIVQLLASGGITHFPHGTNLRGASGKSVPVQGHIAVSGANGFLRGVITLSDAQTRDSEERKLRQEEKMNSVAQLASDVAQDFYGLFDLIARSGEDLAHKTANDESGHYSANLVRQAGETGASIARQLLDFGKHQSLCPQPLDVNEVIEERRSLYTRLCGRSISIHFDLAPSLHFVLSDEMHLEKLVLNLILCAKAGMPTGGSITLSTSNVFEGPADSDEKRWFVRIMIESQRSADWQKPGVSDTPKTESPELTLAVINTIVTVNEGLLNTRHEGESYSATTVLLPAQPLEEHRFSESQAMLRQ